ncbi:MAG: InlB B-repeat-containing protein, partial [Actinomycetes bacterium]
MSLLTTMAVAVPNAAIAAPPTTWSITSSTTGSGSGTVSSQSGLRLIKTSADIFFWPDSGSMVSAISIDGVDLSRTDLSSAVGAGSFTVAQGIAPNYIRAVVVTFSLITYTVHFDNQGHGTAPSDATGVITLAFGSLPSESTDGDYSFSGWSTDAAGNVMVSSDYTPGADSTLYAIWNYNPPFDPCNGYPSCGNTPPTTYTVSFDNQLHGTPQSDETGVTSIAYGDLPPESADGYFTFVGWSSTQDGMGLLNFGGTFTPTSNSTLYAIWQDNTPPSDNTVVFDGNGATFGSMYDEVNSSIVALDQNMFAWAGYTFAGWNTDSRGGSYGTAYENRGNFDFRVGGATLYAQWTPNQTHTVTYAAGGADGTLPTQSDTSEGAIINLASASGLTMAGHYFTGWSDGPGSYSAGYSYTMPSSNLVLTATWSSDIWNLMNSATSYYTTDISGLSVGDSLSGVPKYAGGVILPLPSGTTILDISSTGVDISTTGLCDNGQCDGSIGINAHSTVYLITVNNAIFTGQARVVFDYTAVPPATFTVTYHGGGATSGDVPVDVNAYASGYRVTIASPGNLVKSGFNFRNWTDATGVGGWNGTGTASFLIYENTDIYAVWSSTSYTVSFDNQGHGSAVGDATNVTTIALASLPSESTDGYFIFQGWSETVGGSVLTGDYTPT